MLSAKQLINAKPNLQPVLESALNLVKAHKPCLLIGKPCSGKTLLARTVYFELAKTWRPSAATKSAVFKRFVESNLLDYQKVMQHGFKLEMPFRAPHHTVSKIGMEGSFCSKCGRGLTGEILLSNEGILFLDDIDEFRKGVLDLLPHVLGTTYMPQRGPVPQLVEPVNLRLIATSDSLEQCEKRLPKSLMKRFVILTMPD